MSSGRRGGADEYQLISGGAGDPTLMCGTVDPTAGAGVAADEGSAYFRFVADAGEAWLKYASGDTSWGRVLAPKEVTYDPDNDLFTIDFTDDGNVFQINYEGDGDALNVSLESSLLSRGLVVSDADNVVRDTAQVYLSRQANATGPCLECVPPTNKNRTIVTNGGYVALSQAGDGHERIGCPTAASVDIYADNNRVVWLTGTDFRAMLPVQFKEQSAPLGNVASYGQLVVIDDAPCSFALLDDDGNNIAVFKYNGSQVEISHGVTDTDLFLNPNGSGVVMFGTHAALAGESLSGYITIKDAGGTPRKIGVVS